MREREQGQGESAKERARRHAVGAAVQAVVGTLWTKRGRTRAVRPRVLGLASPEALVRARKVCGLTTAATRSVSAKTQDPGAGARVRWVLGSGEERERQKRPRQHVQEAQGHGTPEVGGGGGGGWEDLAVGREDGLKRFGHRGR